MALKVENLITENLITEKTIADFILKENGVLMTRDIVNINDIQLDKCCKNVLVCLTGYDHILNIFFNQYIYKFTKPIVLILIETDIYTLKTQWIEHPMIVYIFGWNIPIVHTKIHALPIGLNYYRQGIIMNKFLQTYKPGVKMHLLGINFSLSTNPIRHILIDKSNNEWKTYCKQIPYYTNIDKYMRKSYTDRGGIEITVTSPELYKEMSNIKFILSPPGAGIDCHRTWESLIFGMYTDSSQHQLLISYMKIFQS